MSDKKKKPNYWLSLSGIAIQMGVIVFLGAKGGQWLEENGFYEIEISREVDTFGNVIQVFSTYESYYSKKDTAPFMRGINSIQLLNDGERFWVVNIYWTNESEKNPIPEQYLKN